MKCRLIYVTDWQLWLTEWTSGLLVGPVKVKDSLMLYVYALRGTSVCWTCNPYNNKSRPLTISDLQVRHLGRCQSEKVTKTYDPFSTSFKTSSDCEKYRSKKYEFLSLRRDVLLSGS